MENAFCSLAVSLSDFRGKDRWSKREVRRVEKLHRILYIIIRYIDIIIFTCRYFFHVTEGKVFGNRIYLYIFFCCSIAHYRRRVGSRVRVVIIATRVVLILLLLLLPRNNYNIIQVCRPPVIATFDPM